MKVYLKIGSSKTFSGVCEVVTLIEWINNNVKKTRSKTNSSLQSQIEKLIK